MNQEQINNDLREHDSSSSKFQNKILTKLRAYLDASSNEMSQYWDIWESTEAVYRAWRVKDKEDYENEAQNRSAKLIVPVTYAQTQTFISFILSAFNQREYFYELRGRNSEDQRYKEGLQRDLQYQLDKQGFVLHQYNAILSACQYGFHVSKVQWTTEEELVRARRVITKEPTLMERLSSMMLGQPAQAQEIVEEIEGKVVSYEGNIITTVSPYNFLPDPNFPIAEFYKGEFCCDENEVSLARIRSQEGKLYHGTKHIEPYIGTSLWNSRKRRVGTRNASNISSDLTHYDLKGNVILDEVYFYAVPAELSKTCNLDIGKEKDPVLFIATIANDSKLIRFERSGYLHGGFPFAVGEYSPNSNSFINPGLNDMINDLQSLETWMLNSHISNVQSAIKSRFIVNENMVNMSDIEANSSKIRVNKSGDVDKAIKQLLVTDVTQRHIGETEYIHKLIQLVTGINENALGQYATGRRSATEAHNVNAGAAARLQMHAKLLYESSFKNIGKMLIANTRQGRSQSIYEAIIGEDIDKFPFEQVILTPLDKIMGGYDFVPFDATLPSERFERANLLKEVFSMLVSNPQTIQLLNKNPLPLLEHIAELLGITNLKDFNLNAQENALVGQPSVPQVQVVPDEVAMQAAQTGTPVDMSGMNAIQQMMQS